MVKKLSILTVCLGVLAACSGNSTLSDGLALLGEDFARAFAQDHIHQARMAAHVILRQGLLDQFNALNIRYRDALQHGLQRQ